MLRKDASNSINSSSGIQPDDYVQGNVNSFFSKMTSIKTYQILVSNCPTFMLSKIPGIFNLGTAELVLINLVAYEASNASGPLVLTRYSELINRIIDTEEDVKLLRENGVVLNRLRSDAEVAKLWNGISKSIRLTKVPHIDIVIEDVNKYYNSRWRVKCWKNKKLN
ncbi:hypothetical protein CUMW_272930, partial [Citrus unshiu]